MLQSDKLPDHVRAVYRQGEIILPGKSQEQSKRTGPGHLPEGSSDRVAREG